MYRHQYMVCHLNNKLIFVCRDFSETEQNPFFSEIYELDLSTVVPSLSGPKRPHDR
jgi:aconitase A